MDTTSRIPIVCLDTASGDAFHIFNPNDWKGATRGIIQSCATELGVLQFTAERIGKLCLHATDLCRVHYNNLRQQWHSSSWDLARTVVYAQVPELHVLIEGYFAGLKSLLDLSAQLLTTEGVVNVSIHGFHRKKGVYGGSVLQALDRNIKHGKGHLAKAIKKSIAEHKRLWIDEVIDSRDRLVHPSFGTQQLMFELQLESRDAELVCLDVRPPHVGTVPINEYARAR